jgi:cytochrome c biogenesis protein CcmG/thiol:disulfide interchange protein DsbE
LLETAYRRWGDQGVLFIGIQTQDRDQYDAGRQFLSRFDLSFPNGMDNDSRIGVEYALFGVPETFFVDRQGAIVYKQVGPVTEAVLEREMGRLLQ